MPAAGRGMTAPGAGGHVSVCGAGQRPAEESVECHPPAGCAQWAGGGVGGEVGVGLVVHERDVLALMAEGRSNQAIAAQLYLAPKTVETDVSAIFHQARPGTRR